MRIPRSRTSNVIKTFFSRPNQDLNFKTKIKTKTLKFFQDQDQDQDLFVVYTRGRPSEKYFSFSAVNETAVENEIPFTAENETKTKIDIHFRPENENESHLIILVFFSFSYIQSPS